MQKLVFKNSNGVEIDLTSGNYGITEWNGFANVGLNLQTQQVPFSDGSVYLDGLLGEREISVTLAMQDNGNLEERYRMRRELIAVLNPKLGEGVLIYTNDFTSKQIKAVSQIPVFENHNANDSGTPKASLSWTCPSPYWEDVEETTVIMAPDDYISLENSGDIPTQIEIEIKGNVKDPIIQNQTTGKRIEYKGSVSESLKISTLMGDKYVKKGSLGFTWNGGGAIYGIATNGIVTVYVGDNITVEDLEGNRTPVKNPSQSIIFSVVYGNGVFIANSENGIIRSENGYDWEIVASAQDFVTFENGLFIAKSIYSTNGKTWYPGAIHKTVPVFGNGVWVSIIGNYLCTSFDGITWTNRYSNNNGYLCYGSRFIVVNGNTTILSDDGIVWTSQTNTKPQGVSMVSGIVWYKNKYYILGSKSSSPASCGLLESSDGVTWTYNALISYKHEVIFNIKVVKNKLYIYDTYGWCYSTENGHDLSVVIKGTCRVATKIKKIGNTYYLLGDSIYTSTDLENWENAFTNYVDFPNPIRDIFFVGDKCCFFNSSNLFYTEDWGGVYNAAECIYAFYSDNKYHIITSNGSVLGNEDITNPEAWELEHQNNISISKICFAEGLYVGVGSNKIYTTTDFTTWIERVSWTNKLFNAIEYVNHRFFCVGNSGQVLMSTTGLSWIEVSGFPSNLDLYSISFGNGTYLFGGNKFSLFTSSDLVNFTDKSVISYPYVFSIYFEEGTFYIVGHEGSIYKSNYISDENAIQNLSEDSDMTLNFVVGSNFIVFVNQNLDASAYIKYRQKYIGV